MIAAGWLAVAAFPVAYASIATDRVNRVAASVGGAMLMLAVGLTGTAQALLPHATGVGWWVIFLLIGMMIVGAIVSALVDNIAAATAVSLIIEQFGAGLGRNAIVGGAP